MDCSLDRLAKRHAGAMMDKVGERDPSEEDPLWTATGQSGEDGAAGDPAWLFAAVLLIVVLGLWAANAPQVESLVTTLAAEAPR